LDIEFLSTNARFYQTNLLNSHPVKTKTIAHGRAHEEVRASQWRFLPSHHELLERGHPPPMKSMSGWLIFFGFFIGGNYTKDLALIPVKLHPNKISHFNFNCT
jgi:hypothetical protein